MIPNIRPGRPTLGLLAGWQFYRTATNLSYLAPIFRGACRAAKDLGCNLLLGCGIGPSASPSDPLRPAWPFYSTEHDFVPIGPWNTDGLIIAVPLHSKNRSKYVQELITAGHPILFIGKGEPGPTISADNSSGIREAIQHLVDHGHSRIAFIAGSQEDLSGDTGDRLEAFRSGYEIYGLDQDPRLLAFGRHVYDGGYLAMRQIMDSGVKFSAVLTSNDESALGAIEALQKAGRKIPQDVAVIGFDNRLEGALQEPGLTSINVPLFDIGYQAVDMLLKHITGKTILYGNVKINTRLVIRKSCGCDYIQPLSNSLSSFGNVQNQNWEEQRLRLARMIATIIMNEAQSLTEDECLVFCQRMINAFIEGIQHSNRSEFQCTLIEVLERTTAGNDDANIWQDAISLIVTELGDLFIGDSSSALLMNDIVNNARLTISSQMQRQHRQYVVDERWTSSRVSLLTARLLTALDEDQIYQVLAKYLPEMGIHTAFLGVFESESNDPGAWCSLRNLISTEGAPVCFPSREFPPEGLIDDVNPLIWTLIPVVDPSGQIGFMVFDSEYFDLYGVIVQHVGGALNTARLYLQATEGRRLAEEANRLKSRFLSTISHELRTPLNLIVGLSGILLEESDEGKSSLPNLVHGDIERIHAYAQHLGGLIGDVLDLAISDAGQLRLNLELMDLGEALRMVAESGSQLTSDKGLAWKVSLPETGPWVWGDRTRLRQVVLNLVNNAIKFTSLGEVGLFLVVSTGFVTISVQDTGLGIPPEEQAAIFDEFRRSERSISQGYAGLGLGLVICKMLVEMHGGVIGVNSTGVEGEGSTFYLTLPIVQPPVLSEEKTAIAPENKQTIMLLLSQSNTADRLSNTLSQYGVNVQQVLMEQRPTWQSELIKNPPDAIVLDVSHQSDLGWSILKTIKGNQATKGTPVMFYSSSQNGEALFSLDYLTKPIELAELTQALDQLGLIAHPSHPVLTFLVVDDEPSTLEMHARILQSRSPSNRVLKARNGREALNILAQEKVNLLLLDLQMPEMDGFSVLEAMRANEHTRDIPVIVVTGKELNQSDMARFNQGVAVVLKKGLFSVSETMEHISTALERKRRLSLDAQRLVRLAMAFIHEHFSKPISRQDIAQYVNITEDYLTFCFRQELGITPIKYIQRYRVNQAKILLKLSQKSITEIALDTGFSDSGYFSRIFRREAGMSPEAFRLS